MPGGVQRWIPVVLVAIAALPLGPVAVRLMARVRIRRGVPAGVARRMAVAEVAMVGGTMPWIWMVLTPLPAPRELRLTPLADLGAMVAASPLTAFLQIVGNLLVFAAFGFFAPVRWRLGGAARTLGTVAAVAAALSATVESLQFALGLGRVASVDDVLINAVGAGRAAIASRRLWAGSGRPARSRFAARPA